MCGYGLMDYDYTEDNTDENEEYLYSIALTILVETVKHTFELYRGRNFMRPDDRTF